MQRNEDSIIDTLNNVRRIFTSANTISGLVTQQTTSRKKAKGEATEHV